MPETIAFPYIAEGLRPLAVPITSLVPDPGNVRLHDERNLAEIQSSLQAFGQDQPLVVQRQGMIVRKGNGRLIAAKRLGWSHVAVVIVDEGDVRAVARAIADNRSAELARWDAPLLLQTMTHLAAVDPRLAEVTGWSASELEALRTAPLPDAQPTAPPEPAAPGEPVIDAQAPPAEPNPLDQLRDTQQINATFHEPRYTVAFGEVWRAGPHRIIAADPIFDVQRWLAHLPADRPFVPYGGPLALVTQLSDRGPLYVVQPDTYIVGHMLEHYADTHPGEEVAREHA